MIKEETLIQKSEEVLTKSFSSNGKLLLTAEYLILKGSKALAVPVKFKQWMIVKSKNQNPSLIKWTAKSNGNQWFDAEIDARTFEIIKTNDNLKSEFLIKLFNEIRKINPLFLSDKRSYRFETDTNFPIDWGLGSSSTLIANLAKFSNTDPFELSFRVSNGSGYDIACALSGSPLFYQLMNSKPVITRVSFTPRFHKKLYFVYLGRKKSTAVSVDEFLKKSIVMKCDIEYITKLTDHFFKASTFKKMEIIINEHEKILSEILEIRPVKEQFPDFEGEMKSLGAWGGDFILVTWKNSFYSLKEYFSAKGLHVVIPYKQMVL